MPTDWSKTPFIKPSWHSSATGVDVETGGFDPYKNGIVEIGAISHDHLGNERGRFHSLVNPGDHAVLNPDAMKTHGISEEQIRSAPHIKDVLPSFMQFMKDHHETSSNTDASGKTWVTPKTHLVGHNLGFDNDQIMSALRMHAPHLLGDWNQVSRHKHDTQQFSPVYDKQSTLKGLGKLYGVPNPNPHSAMGDVAQTLGIFHQQRGMQRYMHNGLAAERHQNQMGQEDEGRQQFFASSKTPTIKWCS